MAVQIQVSNEIWKKLMKLKKKPNHTFDEIISSLIKLKDNFKLKKEFDDILKEK